MAVRGGAVALAAALAAATVAAGLAAGRAPQPGLETTRWLAVESLAIDGDLRLDEADRARFTSRFGHRPVDALVVDRGPVAHFDTPWLWSRIAALSRVAVGRSGPALLQWGLFAWSAVMAAATLASRVGGGSGSLLVLVALGGSAASLAPLGLEPRALEMAALATAAATVWYRRLGPMRPADDVFRGSLDARPSSLRWGVAGALFGPVLVSGPAYLPLALPLVAAAPAGRRGLAGGLFGVGAASTAGALVLLSGPPWEALAGAPSPALYAWAAVGLLFGRGVGLLPYFVPAVLLAMLAGRGDGKRWVLPAIAGAAVVQVAVAPYDFVDGALGAGNAWFLPPLALLLVAAESAESARGTLAVGAIGLPLIVAPWLAALGATHLAAAVATRTAVVERMLPIASTLRRQPGTADLRRGAVTVRGFAPGVAGGSDGKLRLRGARGELLVTSDRPISSLRVELGREAPARIDLGGGALGNVTYRPGGEVALDVSLDPRRARRHPVWWSPDGAWVHRLEFRLGTAPAAPVPLDVPFARPAVPENGP